MSAGRAKHSATRWTNLWASPSILAMYFSTRSCAPGASGYCVAGQYVKQPRVIRLRTHLEESPPGWVPQAAARMGPGPSIPSCPGFQSHIAWRINFDALKKGEEPSPGVNRLRTSRMSVLAAVVSAPRRVYPRKDGEWIMLQRSLTSAGKSNSRGSSSCVWRIRS